MDIDSEWWFLLNCDKIIGKCLDIDLDFVCLVVVFEICVEDEKWVNVF